MNKQNIDKWIMGMRKQMVEHGVDDSTCSDDDIIEILMGLMIPALPEESREVFERVGTDKWGKMYFKSMLSMVKPEGDMFEGIDYELLRAKLNLN